MKTALVALFATLCLCAFLASTVGEWLDHSLAVSIGGTR